MNILVSCAGGSGIRTMSPDILKRGYVAAIAEPLINEIIPLVKTVNATPIVMWHEPGGRPDDGPDKGKMQLHQVQDLAKRNPNLANEFGMAVEMVGRYAKNVIYLGIGAPDNGKFDREYYRWAMSGIPDGTICIDSLGVQPVDHPDAEFVRQITRDSSKHREIWVEGGPLSQWSDFNCVLDVGDPGLWDFANKKAKGKYVLHNDRASVGRDDPEPWRRNFNPTIRDLRAFDRIGIHPFVQHHWIKPAEDGKPSLIDEWKKP